MDFNAIYHFLFETFQGIGVLVAAGFIISIIACFVLEMKTRRTYQDRGPADDNEEFLFFDCEDDPENN